MAAVPSDWEVTRRSDLTVGDTAVPYRAALNNGDGPIDLSGSTVSFRMVLLSETLEVKIGGDACVIDDAANGLVHYEWNDVDVDTAEVYAAWFIREDNSTGATERIPQGERYIRIRFAEAL